MDSGVVARVMHFLDDDVLSIVFDPFAYVRLEEVPDGVAVIGCRSATLDSALRHE